MRSVGAGLMLWPAGLCWVLILRLSISTTESVSVFSARII
jgi:hypothetical protein